LRSTVKGLPPTVDFSRLAGFQNLLFFLTALRSFKVVQRVSWRDATGVRRHSNTHTSECYHISKRCLEFLSSFCTRICNASARSRPCRSAHAPTPSIVRNAVRSDRETCSSKLPFRKSIDQSPHAAVSPQAESRSDGNPVGTTCCGWCSPIWQAPCSPAPREACEGPVATIATADVGVRKERPARQP
jgi:hypothetical protein